MSEPSKDSPTLASKVWPVNGEPSFVLSEMEKNAAEFLSGLDVDEIATEEDFPEWDPFSVSDRTKQSVK